jgi:hypothetical protein
MRAGGAQAPPTRNAPRLCDDAAYTQVLRALWQCTLCVLETMHCRILHRLYTGGPFEPPGSISSIHLHHLELLQQESHLRQRWGNDRCYLPYQQMLKDAAAIAPVLLFFQLNQSA